MATKRTNEEWINDLSTPGLLQETALEDLREIVKRGLPYALSSWLSPTDPKLDSLVEEATQETLLRVLSHLSTFEGRSQFTTWVHKIAVRIAITELRRKRWQDTSLDDLLEAETGMGIGLMADSTTGPEVAAEQAEMFSLIEQIVQEELTEKQRNAMVAIRIHGMPMDEIARQMGMTRNALYKLLHDARLRLKRRLVERGLTPEEILASFEVP
ncbi:MAG: sigma-70 family RNA polymerase sigma factor [Anaerolineales bacterium]|nr:sigma-70 family RNA polymerase sigma factor [Anaerolineales bacterium]